MKNRIQNSDSVELLIEGSTFYPQIFDAIIHAEHSIYLENYLVEEGDLWSVLVMLLKGAADKGVSVFCIFDDFGSLDVQSELEALNQHPNVSIKRFNPIKIQLGLKGLRRTHIKLFVVDEYVAFTGGAGITDNFYDPIAQSSKWSEVMIKVQGHSLDYVCTLFLWRYNSIDAESHRFKSSLRMLETYLHPALDGWLYAHHFSTHWIKRALYRQLAKAEKRIWINSAYFFPTRKTLRYLKKKALSGVDVRLLLPGMTDVLVMKYLARKRYRKLLSAGVSIHEINDRFLHSKVVLIDDWVTLGSFNLDVLSFRFNHELNYASSDPLLVKDVEGFFLSNLELAEEINPAKWTHRLFISKLLERFTYRCALLLEKLLK